MNTIKTTLAALALLLVPATRARADEQRGFTFGVRAAYALPFGDATSGQRLSGLTTGAAPAQLEVGWRFDERWQAGAYLSYGSAFLGSDARDSLRARGARHVRGHSEQRLGLQGFYTLPHQGRLAPWVGLALGLESTRYAQAHLAEGDRATVGFLGVETALQAGADWKLSRRMEAGPFLAVHGGRYFSRLERTEEDDKERVRGVRSPAPHGWLELGVRGTFDL